MRTAAIFLAIVLVAASARLLAAPGADAPHGAVGELLGRAARFDAYWYTRAAVRAARGAEPEDMTAKFDRPLYTAWCRAVWAAAGLRESTVALPATLAGAIGAGLVFLLGRAGGLSPFAAVLGALFAATSWIVVAFDREPIVYSTADAGLLAGMVVWAYGFRRPVLFVIGWGLILAAAALGKETILLAVPGLALAQAMAIRRARRGPLILVASALVAVGGAAIAVLLAPGFARDVLRKLASRTTLRALASPADWLPTLADLPFHIDALVQTPAIGALLLVGVLALLLERVPPDPAAAAPVHFRRALALWLGIGLLALLVLLYRPTRYFLALFPPAFLLAAHGAAALLGRAEARVEAGPRATWLATFAVVVTGLFAIGAVLAALGPDIGMRFLRSRAAGAVRIGACVAIAALAAWALAPRLVAAGRLRPLRPIALALVALAFAEDALVVGRMRARATYDDLAARRAFEHAVGPGAVVAGATAQYLAFDPRYDCVFDVTPRPLLLDRARRGKRPTHVVTLLVPELPAIERLAAQRGRPLHVVADVVIGRERHRIYRLWDAEAHGYALTPFERARALAESGPPDAAARAWAELVGGEWPASIALAYAGASAMQADLPLARRLLTRAVEREPRNGSFRLLLARAHERAGDHARADALRATLGAYLRDRLPLAR